MTSISNHSVLKEVTHVLILCTPRLEVELKKMGWQPLTGREGKGDFPVRSPGSGESGSGEQEEPGAACLREGGPFSLSTCQAHDLPAVSRRLFSSPQSMSLVQESLLNRSRLSRRKKAQGSTWRAETLLLVISREGIQLQGRSSGEGAPLTPNVPCGVRGHGRGRAGWGLQVGDRRPSETVSPSEPESGDFSRMGRPPTVTITPDSEDPLMEKTPGLLMTPAVLVHKTSAMTSTLSYFDPSSWL